MTIAGKDQNERIALFEKFADFLPFIIYKTDHNGNILFATGSAAKSIGLNNNALVGMNVSKAFSINEIQLHKAVIGEDNQFVAVIEAIDHEAYFEHTIFPDYLGGGGFFCYATDITKYMVREKRSLQLQTQLEQRVRELDGLNKLKDKTFAVLSHDLKSPINSVTSLIPLLTDEPVDMEIIKHDLYNRLYPLNEVVDNLFRWATISFKNWQPTINKPLDIYEIAQRNIDLLQFTAKAKNINIVNDVPQRTTIVANSDQVDIVIRNLLANAVKFTQVNGIILISGGIKNDKTEISVTDTGVGMSAAQLDDLFTAYQLTTYGTVGEKGTGLGLLLCKEYVEANKGRIIVSSEEGKGTKFKIIF